MTAIEDAQWRYRTGLLPADDPLACALEELAGRRRSHVFRAIGLVDVTTGQVSAPRELEVVDGTVVDRGPTPPADDRPRPCEWFAAPGFVDAHAHVSSVADLVGLLAYGVTGYRQMWGEPAHRYIAGVYQARHAVVPRPWVATGIVDGPRSRLPEAATIVADARAVRHVIDEAIGFGFDGIKVYDDLDEPVFVDIVDEARRAGLPVVGHVPERVPLERACRGMRSTEHLYGVVPNVFRLPPTTRWTALAEALARRESGLDALAAGFAGHFLCPTLTAWRARTTERRHTRPSKATIQMAAGDRRRAWSVAAREILATEGPVVQQRSRLVNRLGYLARGLTEHGARLLVGTDCGNPFVVAGPPTTRRWTSYPGRGSAWARSCGLPPSTPTTSWDGASSLVPPGPAWSSTARRPPAPSARSLGRTACLSMGSSSTATTWTASGVSGSRQPGSMPARGPGASSTHRQPACNLRRRPPVQGEHGPDVTELTEPPVVDFDFFNSPAEYRRAAQHARDGVFYSGHGTGFWVLTTYDKIWAAFRNEDDFTVRRISAAEGADAERWIPLTVEGRQHAEWRRLLAGWFTPKRVRELTPAIRENARRRIARLASGGTASFTDEFARPYVLQNLMTAIGWPVADLDHLLRINLAMLAARSEPDPREAFQSELGLPALEAYVRKHIERRRAAPAGDLTTATFNWAVDGVPVTDDDRTSLLSVLFLAGVDSTVNHLANAIQHLACYPADRQRFCTDTDIRSTAVEEFLRAFSCMYPGRMAARDGACPFARHGQTVLLPLALANHDPEVFPEPGRVNFDRESNPHIAFGAGHHQCLGAALARAQIRTALDEWHAQIPHYTLPPTADSSAPPFLRNSYDLRLVW
jgi:cytochrome P450